MPLTESFPPAPADIPSEPAAGPEHPWESCVWPLVAFLALGVLEPSPSGGGLAGALGLSMAAYPAIYALRLAVTLALLAWHWPTIRRWLGRPTWWTGLVGLLLVIPWVILAALQRDAGWAGWAGGSGERSAFNPFAEFAGSPAATWGYLLLRGLGLVVVVPIVEELFLRGFLMRYVVDEDFWKVPFGTLTAASVGACAVYSVATHPAEAVAALSWFAIVTGIAAATRQPIDCILAHAGTNLALGAWVLATGAWWLV